VEIRLLGPVGVRDGVRAIDLGTPRQRTVLAVLAAEADRPVRTEALIDRVWGDRPPQDPRAAVYGYVSRLRRVLGKSGPVRSGGGYLLPIEPEQVDLHLSRRLSRRARADADPQLLREALRLWHGTPLADLPGGWAARTRDAWRQEHLDLVVAWGRAELDAGRPDEVIETARPLVAEHPLAEPVIGLLVRALGRAGRDGEALETYAAARARLVAELGVEPGADLRGAHATVLCGEATPAAVARPAQLPPDVAVFTGRTAELAALDGAGAVSVISGTAGVGKTALALHWAHRVAARFPDGQLYVNLRGYDPDQPLDPCDALARFLRALDVAANDIPADLDERAARYRTELTGRRILIVVDNAGTVEQVRPLLPGTPTATVTVTSRDSLAGLVAVDGAYRIDLDLLPRDDAVTLLRRLIGARVDSDAAAADTLVDQCARLPLALRVAAELAAARPRSPLTALVAELTDERRRLDLLDAGGDPRAAVAAVFSWSYRHLTRDAAQLFRLLGLHPGPDLDAYAAAALIDGSIEDTQRLLAALTRAHVITFTGSDRYGMHDLLRAYAAMRARDEDSASQRRAALTRLFDYYLSTAGAAMTVLHPAEAQLRTLAPPSGTPSPDLSDPDTALRWLDTERTTLVAVAVHTAAHGWPTHTTRLARTLFRYLNGGHNTDAVIVHGQAHQAALRSGDPTGQAHALTDLGVAHRGLGRPGPAIEHYQRALDLFRQVGDPAGQARALNNLGNVEQLSGRYQQAADQFEQALTLYRQTGDRTGEARALANLGTLEGRLGRYRPAIDHFAQALALYRRAGDRDGEAHTLNSLGSVEVRSGRYPQAGDHLQQALSLFRQLGDHTGEASVLDSLGLLHTRVGQPDQAAELHLQALAILRHAGYRDGEAWALNGLGEAAQAAGRPAEACVHHTAAQALAADIGDRDQQARAHAGLARAYHTLGDPARAREQCQRALTLYAELGPPEADEVRAHLATLDNPGPDSGF
jgi:tetratricopeptide (TPR) repeat protein